MVLLHDIVSIFHLTDGDGCAVGLVVAFDGGFIGVTVVDGHGVRETIATDGLLQKPQRGCCIPVLREEKVNGLAVFIHRTIQIPPLPLHFDVRLVHPPADPDRPLPAMKRLFQLGAIFDDPAVDGRVIHVDPTFNRWVIKYSPQLEEAFHRRKRPVWVSWRMDETYIKVKGQWRYLYRAVDKHG